MKTASLNFVKTNITINHTNNKEGQTRGLVLLTDRFEGLPNRDKELIGLIVKKSQDKHSVIRMVDEAFPPCISEDGSPSYSKIADIALEKWLSLNKTSKVTH